MTDSALRKGNNVSEQPQAAGSHAAAENGSAAVEKCLNCQFYDRKNGKPTDGTAPLWGQCRRNAPHLNPMTAKPYVIEGIWPLVRDDDWCGEWKMLARALGEPIRESEPALARSAAARSRTASAGQTAPIVAAAGAA
jgi:hypothetical protein